MAEYVLTLEMRLDKYVHRRAAQDRRNIEWKVDELRVGVQRQKR